jgi:ABC-type lipoprotein export system ATPase subunit
MIRLERVSRSFQGARGGATIKAVDGVDLIIEPGECVVVTGRSGSGKTTLLNLMAGLIQPSAGRVVLEDIDLAHLSDSSRSALRNEKCGFVFQFPSLIPTLTALENVTVPALVNSRGSHGDARARASELLAAVGMGDRAEAYPCELSAGQEQRVVLARALWNGPRVLLADEPTSHLDETTEREILTMLSELHCRLGMTTVLVTHNRALGGRGTRTIEMVDGRVTADTKNGSSEGHQHGPCSNTGY